MPLLNYTTTIAADKTVAEIQAILAAHGARRITLDYDAGHIMALEFEVDTPNGTVPIRLPTDPRPVLAVMRRQKVPARYLTEQQALNVAWRIVKDWVSAQMAIIETRMVVMEQVFLPYIVSPTGDTLYDALAQRRFLLTAPDETVEGETVDDQTS
jgi:hypothetical protein